MCWTLTRLDLFISVFKGDCRAITNSVPSRIKLYIIARFWPLIKFLGRKMILIIIVNILVVQYTIELLIILVTININYLVARTLKIITTFKIAVTELHLLLLSIAIVILKISIKSVLATKSVVALIMHIDLLR